MQVTVKSLKPQVNEDDAFKFLDTLHGDTEGYIGITLIATDGKVRAGFDRVDAMREALSDGRFFTDMIEFGNRRWNIYTSVGTFSECPKPGSRGFASQVGEIPGVWADFDVKPGQADAFQTREELEEYLLKLPPMTMRVNTGSGGVHGYWLFPEPLKDMRKAVSLLSAWHAFLSEKAEGKAIDNVQELARILRVAGTVRWPKSGEDGGPVTVELAFFRGPRYEVKDLVALSKPAYTTRKAAQAHKSEVWREERKKRQEAMVGVVVTSLSGRDSIERGFSTCQDWGPLLEKAGWTLHKDNRSGDGTTACRYWAQPGMSSGYSAMTDFRDSQVMILYTSHPDWDKISVPDMVDRSGRRMSTKFQFALGALYDGDEVRLLTDIVKGRGVLC